jgi:hypothetical protein
MTNDQDIILLEGFEKKLKKSLFDPTIDKTSNIWDLSFLKLKNWLKTKKDYPTQDGNKELYHWIAMQRYLKKNGSLNNERIRKLNSINFVWDMQEWKWNSMYSQLVEYAKENVFEPYKEINPELAKWYKTQITLLKSDTLTEDKIFKIKAVVFKGPANRNKWIPLYNSLVEFKRSNPNSLPTYNKINTTSIEKRLNFFCRTIRTHYKNDDLGDYWFEKMNELDFNFEVQIVNWFQIFGILKNFIEKNNRLPKSGEKYYQWFLKHKNEYDNGKMKEKHIKYWAELGVDKYIISWDDTFKNIKEWVSKNGKIPTKLENAYYYGWLYNQKNFYKNGTLSDEQVVKLGSIGFDLEINKNEVNAEKWLSQFNEYKNFIDKYGHEPSVVTENKLYIWVQTQRAHYAGNLKNRKPIPQNRIDLLNSINFIWVGKVLGERNRGIKTLKNSNN